ncbi:hypothetical protein [Agaribacterium haliotis]|uniref:hypothetical protein n=1 Tax=Agaribacterium haliotis TaxID=2013869 RepID=UPI000BB53EFE|nr:hypothetical protein [Agaribacterium haliotis]
MTQFQTPGPLAALPNSLTTKRAAVALTLTGLLSACGGDTAFPSEPLNLDYTLELRQLGEEIEHLSGISLNFDNGAFAVLGQGGDIVMLDSVGLVLERFDIDIGDSKIWTGIEYAGDEQYLLSTLDGEIHRLYAEQQYSELEVDLSFDISELNAVAYDFQQNSILAISEAPYKVLFTIKQDGRISQKKLEPRFDNYRIEGLHMGEQGLYIMTRGYELDAEPRANVVIKTDAKANFDSAWQLDAGPSSGLVVIDEQAPRIISAFNDTAASLKSYEPEPETSTAEFTALSSIDKVELNFNQPSGLDYHSRDNLFSVSDFGEIRHIQPDGQNTLLFSLDDQQGSYEAIASDGPLDHVRLHLLKSLENSGPSKIESYTRDGLLLTSRDIQALSPQDSGQNASTSEHVFDALDYVAANDLFYLINASAGRAKYLYQLGPEQQQNTALGTAYTPYQISALSVDATSNTLYFSTDEYMQNGNKYAGLLIKYDLTQQQEIGRFSIVDGDNNSIGAVSPSGLALDLDLRQLLISSDMDNSAMHIFELPE